MLRSARTKKVQLISTLALMQQVCQKKYTLTA